MNKPPNNNPLNNNLPNNNHKQLTSPCHHCTDRKLLCHSTCILYQDFSQSRTQANLDRFKATELIDYKNKVILKEARRKNYKK